MELDIFLYNFIKYLDCINIQPYESVCIILCLFSCVFAVSNVPVTFAVVGKLQD